MSHDQTRYIFETNTICVENEVLNVDDVLETANHFRCIDMIIDHAKTTLSENFIKDLHLTLKNGTSDSRKEWFVVGDYKKVPNEVGGMNTALPEEVPGRMKELLKEYNGKKEKTFEDILDFHVRFERIHPFQDGNGRTGRLILNYMLEKEGYPPIALKHDAKQDYKKSLEEWQVRGNPKMFLDVVKNCVLDELQERIHIITVTRETMKALNMDLNYENSKEQMELDDDLEI